MGNAVSESSDDEVVVRRIPRKNADISLKQNKTIPSRVSMQTPRPQPIQRPMHPQPHPQPQSQPRHPQQQPVQRPMQMQQRPMQPQLPPNHNPYQPKMVQPPQQYYAPPTPHPNHTAPMVVYQPNPMQQQQQQQQPPMHAFPQFPNRVQEPPPRATAPQPHQLIASHANLGNFLYEDRGLDALIERPLPSLGLDKSNFHDKITEYEEGCVREEREFDEHERVRKDKFQKYMKKKREKLKEEIRAFEETYDPFEVLGLPKGDYNLSNIRKAYKKMALKYHPDKAGEEYAPQFQVITQSYIYLLKRAEEIETKKCSAIDRAVTTPTPASQRKKKMDLPRKILEREEQMNGLRRGTSTSTPTRVQDFLEEEGDEEEKTSRPEVLDARDGRFDLNRFNQMFEKMKMKDEHDDGYGDLLKRGDDAEGDEETTSMVFNKNMNREIFNAHFDNIKSRKAQAHRSRGPVLPDAMDSSNHVACAKIGSANGDFSIGNYSDIKKAHYEDNLLIDPSTVRRREYRNIDDLEAERSRLSYHPDEETKQVYDQYENSLQEYERQRQEYVNRRDVDLRRHHQRVSRKISVRSGPAEEEE